jgi:hypothetical protein
MVLVHMSRESAPAPRAPHRGPGISGSQRRWSDSHFFSGRIGCAWLLRFSDNTWGKLVDPRAKVSERRLL